MQARNNQTLVERIGIFTVSLVFVLAQLISAAHAANQHDPAYSTAHCDFCCVASVDDDIEPLRSAALPVPILESMNGKWEPNTDEKNAVGDSFHMVRGPPLG